MWAGEYEPGKESVIGEWAEQGGTGNGNVVEAGIEQYPGNQKLLADTHKKVIEFMAQIGKSVQLKYELYATDVYADQSKRVTVYKILDTITVPSPTMHRVSGRDDGKGGKTLFDGDLSQDKKYQDKEGRKRDLIVTSSPRGILRPRC